ncbi:hypothetical protein PTKIN_Ptkin15bG0118900 [Pterospermum kingtungense]
MAQSSKPIHSKLNASRNLRTPSQSSSGQVEVDAKPHIVEAFGPPKTADEMLAAFQNMEASFDDADMGLASLNVGLQLYREGCLNRADSLLRRLKEEGVASVEEIRPGVQRELGHVKRAMGRVDEAIENFTKALDIMEMTLEKDGKKLGVAYRDLADGYLSISDFKEALPLALKALEIHKEELGHDSGEVAHDRRILEAIYSGAGEHKRALEQFELSRKIFKDFGLSSELLSVEMDAANMQITLGMFDEAIHTLKGTVQKTENEEDNENQAGMFILIEKALCNQGKYADSKRCLEIALRIIDKKETISPGHNYNNLGVAYLESERPQLAAQMFAIAKDSFDVSRGPHHPNSIVACQNISIAYSSMGR